MGSVVADLRYAARVLLRSPGFALAAVVVLALGIGANTAIFSIVSAVLLRPLPFAAAGQLVDVSHVPPQKSFPGLSTFSVCPANYLDWQSRNHVFENMAAYRERYFVLNGKDQPESLTGASVTASFFSVLGGRPVLGRTFLPEEDQPGHDRVAVLSYAFWQTHLGSNPAVLGQPLFLDGQRYTVVGIMPPSFTLPAWDPAAAQLWTPLGWSPQERAERKNHSYRVVARLRPGVSVERAQAEMTNISARLAQQYPEADSGWGAAVVSLRQHLVGEVRTTLLILLGAVGFVLLIACANVANLVLAKTLSRRKELAIRAALGASRTRALAHGLAETLLLSFVGGALGLLVANFSITFIVKVLAKDLPRATEVALDGHVLTFTLLLSCLAGLAAGLVPAWRSTKTDLNDALKRGLGRGGSETAGDRTRNLLVVVEVALSLVLLVGAGLMIRSLLNLQTVNPGFEAHNLLTMTVSLPEQKYASPAQQTQFFDRLLSGLQTIPAVQSAALITSLPLNEGGSTEPLTIEGRPSEVFAEQPEVAVRQISPAYFTALRIPLRRGRFFSASDKIDAKPVVIVSESMARRFWPDQNPIGQRLTLSFFPGIPREVVGVVGDVKQRALDTRSPVATLYQPFAQNPVAGIHLVVRTATPPYGLIPAITRSIHSLDPEQPVQDVASMDTIVARSLSQRRFSMLLLGAFAVLAMFVAMVGIYSVQSYMVRRRVREIGLRMALGSQLSDVVRLIVAQGLKPTLAGVVIGLAVALALGRVLATFVYEVRSFDPLTLLVVSLLLTLVAVAASLLPAYRATKIDPIQALRDE